MNINLKDGRRINLYVDEEKNIVIFPISKTKETVQLSDGTVAYKYHTAYFPIELKVPYTAEQLAEKIEYGIEQWNCHECYKYFSGRNTFEEKYYGIKGFKNAIKGKVFLSLGYDEYDGKYVKLFAPMKRGYAYYMMAKKELFEDADWIDFANAVIELMNADIVALGKKMQVLKSLNL